MKKKILALALALCMSIGILPTAFAAELDENYDTRIILSTDQEKIDDNTFIEKELAMSAIAPFAPGYTRDIFVTHRWTDAAGTVKSVITMKTAFNFDNNPLSGSNYCTVRYVPPVVTVQNSSGTHINIKYANQYSIQNNIGPANAKKAIVSVTYTGMNWGYQNLTEKLTCTGYDNGTYEY